MISDFILRVFLHKIKYRNYILIVLRTKAINLSIKEVSITEVAFAALQNNISSVMLINTQIT